MAARLTRNYTVHDMRDEILYFNSLWKRSFTNGRATYIALSNNSTIKLTNTTPRGKVFPVVIQRYKKGSVVVVIDTAVHLPPHSTRRL